MPDSPGGVVIRATPIKLPDNVRSEARQARMMKVLERGAAEIGQHLQRVVQEESLSGQNLNVRSGYLRGSINFEVRSSPDRLETGVGSEDSHEYGAIHEFGGEIRPVRAQRLWIPGVDNVTPTGQPQSSPSDWYPFTGLVFFPNAPGEYEVFNPAEGWRHLFSLRLRVQIPATHWLSEPIEGEEQEVKELWQKAIDTFVGGENAQ